MADPEDKEAVDRAFAELVAGFHLTAERPEPPPTEPPAGQAAPAPGSVFEPPPVAPPAPGDQRSTNDPPGWEAIGAGFGPSPVPDPMTWDQSTWDEPAEAEEVQPEPEETFDPGPPPPLPRPTWPTLLGWIGLGYAAVAVLAVAVGITLPRWAAWAALIGFVGGFALLVSRLPRQRPPDAGDGAVL